MRFFNLILVFIFLVSTKSFATAQVPDYLIIGVDTLRIQSNPLEEYFKTNPIPEKLITSMTTANWRGYIAYFKFLDNKLVVENIYKEDYKEGNNGKSEYLLTSIYKDVFGVKANFDCDFYSGLLICPSGKMLEYVHMGYSSIYENYNLIEIKNGVNIKSKKLTGEDFQNFKIEYFKYFKRTEEYKLQAKQFKEMMLEVNKSNLDSLGFDENPKKKVKENKSLKRKEAEFKVDKQLDSFMFAFLNDYIKTIEIPNN
jgi:hypothetical protein